MVRQEGSLRAGREKPRKAPLVPSLRMAEEWPPLRVGRWPRMGPLELHLRTGQLVLPRPVGLAEAAVHTEPHPLVARSRTRMGQQSASEQLPVPLDMRPKMASAPLPSNRQF